MNKRKAARQNDNPSRWTTAKNALVCLRSGVRVFIGSGCATPQTLVAALAARGPEVFDVEIIHILTFADAPYAKRELLEHFRHNAFFRARVSGVFSCVTWRKSRERTASPRLPLTCSRTTTP
jgi:hypothetical protein